MLLKHLALGNTDRSEEEIKIEKQTLLEEYERKSVVERMSVVSLARELKMSPDQQIEEGEKSERSSQEQIPGGSKEQQQTLSPTEPVQHELIDIKNDFQRVKESYHKISQKFATSYSNETQMEINEIIKNIDHADLATTLQKLGNIQELKENTKRSELERVEPKKHQLKRSLSSKCLEEISAPMFTSTKLRTLQLDLDPESQTPMKKEEEEKPASEKVETLEIGTQVNCI